MISDHVENESMVQQMFSYANAHGRGNNHMPNRTAQSNQERLSKMEAELVKSKQNVVKHVLESRKLEKSIVQVELIEQALQLRLETSLGLHTGQYVKYLQMLTTKIYDFSLNEEEIYSIELACELSPPSIGKALYNILCSFADNSFAEKLESLEINPALITPEFYYKVSNASSNGAIDRMESNRLYNHANILTSQHKLTKKENVTSTDVDALRWKVLKGLLRRKLLLIKLTMTVVQSPDYIQQPSQHLSTLSTGNTFNLTTGTSYSNTSGILNKSTSSALSISVPSNHTQNNLPIYSTHNNTSSSGTGMHSSSSESKLLVSPGRLRPTDLLSTSLQQSIHKQQNIKSKISSTILSMYTTDILPIEIIRKNKNTLQKFRIIGIEKIINSIYKVKLYYLKKKLLKWYNIINIIKIEYKCIKYQKYISIYRIKQIIQLYYTKILKNTMIKFKEFLNFKREIEYKNSILIIQKLWRGSLTRHKTKININITAATTMQSLIRVFLAKKFTKELIRIKKLRYYVKKIELYWKKHLWLRTLKKAFILNKKIRNIIIIQTCYRCYIAKNILKLKKLIKLKERNAIIFQSLFRRYRAILKVDLIKLNKKYSKSIIKIQSIYRCYIQKIKYNSIFIINNNAKIIQYTILRYIAYKKMKKLLINKKIIKIQSFIRGIICRYNIKLLKLNQLNAYKERMHAINRIKPCLLGYFIRKKYKPIILNYLKKRKNAAIILQKKLIAIKLGQKIRIQYNQIKLNKKELIYKNKIIIKIQKIIRGMLGKIKAKKQLILYNKKLEELNKLPYYYRLKYNYYHTQNLLFNKNIIIIQKFIRCYLAKKIMKNKRKNKNAIIIKKQITKHYNIKQAKLILEIKKQEFQHKLAKIACANYIIIKFLIKYKKKQLLKKQLNIQIILWFLNENNIINKIKQIKINYNIQNSIKYIQNKASIKIQALIRKKLTIEYVKKSRKRLERQRQIRKIDKRKKAAIIIQCIIRIYLAYKKYKLKKFQKEENERELREYEDLELSIKDCHEEFMNELLIIRAQKGVRFMIARK